MSVSTAAYRATMSEADLQSAVVKLAGVLGYRCYHTKFSIGSDRGFPDLVLVRPPRLIFVELKREGKAPATAQDAWLDALAACGVPAYVWHPSDWHSGTIEEVLR